MYCIGASLNCSNSYSENWFGTRPLLLEKVDSFTRLWWNE